MKRTKPLRQPKPKRPPAKPTKAPKAAAPAPIASELDAMTEDQLTGEAGMRHSTSNIAWTRRPKAWVAEIWGAMAKPNRNRAAANLRAGGFDVETHDEDAESRHRASYFVEVRGLERSAAIAPLVSSVRPLTLEDEPDDPEADELALAAMDAAGSDEIEDSRPPWLRELSSSHAAEREAHAAKLDAPAPTVRPMDGRDCGVIGPRGASCTLDQGHEGGHCDLVGRSWGAPKPSKPTAIAVIDHAGGGALLSVEKAREFLATSRNADEVRDVADRARAVELYMRSRGAALESQNDAAEIRLRAERRLGELMREQPKASGTVLAGQALGGPKLRPPSPDDPKTLAEQGIDKRDAAKWQQLAAIPKTKFEEFVETTRSKGERITTSAPLKLARQERKGNLAAELRAKPLPIVLGRFDVIAGDPSWMYEKRKGDINRRGATDYPTMTTDEICALPIAERAEANCILWLWFTNAFMRDMLRVIDAWGFSERTILTWDKERMGTGDWLRGQTEHCVLATRGSPIVQLTNETTLLRAPRREHSRKPDEFFDLVNKLCPGTKLELFAREARPGWAAWGAEKDKFTKREAAA